MTADSDTTVEPTLSAPAALLAYSDDHDQMQAADTHDDSRAPWWRPAILAAAILAAAAALAGTIYLVGQPTERAVPVAAPETITLIPPAPPPPPPAPAAQQTVVAAPPTVTVTAEPPAPTTAPITVVPPFAPTPTQDAGLITMLRGDGWAIWDPSIVIRQAHYACKLFRQGEDPGTVNGRLAQESGMGMGPALQLTASAMIAYLNCRRTS